MGLNIPCDSLHRQSTAQGIAGEHTFDFRISLLLFSEWFTV